MATLLHHRAVRLHFRNDRERAARIHAGVAAAIKALNGENCQRLFNLDPDAPFNSGSVNSDAVTILHELGHIYEDLYGLGSTLLVDDSNGNTAASQYNTNLVSKNCFPGGT
jgi:hypothetical protein